jgi:hypothetical protein
MPMTYATAQSFGGYFSKIAAFTRAMYMQIKLHPITIRIPNHFVHLFLNKSVIKTIGTPPANPTMILISKV